MLIILLYTFPIESDIGSFMEQKAMHKSILDGQASHDWGAAH